MSLRNATWDQAQSAISARPVATASANETDKAARKGSPMVARPKGRRLAPIGPCVVSGLDYANLLLQTSLDGDVVQK